MIIFEIMIGYFNQIENVHIKIGIISYLLICFSGMVLCIYYDYFWKKR